MNELPIEERAPWSPADAEELYAVKTWSAGFFGVNAKGHVSVHPVPGSDLEIRGSTNAPSLLIDGMSLAGR